MASFDCDRHCVEWVTFADWAHWHPSPLSTSFTVKLICILLIKRNLKNGPEFPPYWTHVISIIGVLFFVWGFKCFYFVFRDATCHEDFVLSLWQNLALFPRLHWASGSSWLRPLIAGMAGVPPLPADGKQPMLLLLSISFHCQLLSFPSNMEEVSALMGPWKAKNAEWPVWGPLAVQCCLRSLSCPVLR